MPGTSAANQAWEASTPTRRGAPGGEHGLEIAADVAGRNAARAQAGNGEMGEVLTDAAPLLEHLGERRRDRRALRIEGELAVNARAEIVHGLDERAARRERRRRERRHLRRDESGRRIEDEVPRLAQLRIGLLDDPPQPFLPGLRHDRARLRARLHLHHAARRDEERGMLLLHGEVEHGVAEHVAALGLLGRRRVDGDVEAFRRLARRPARAQPCLVVAENDRQAVLVTCRVYDAVLHAVSETSWCGACGRSK